MNSYLIEVDINVVSFAKKQGKDKLNYLSAITHQTSSNIGLELQ